MSDDVTAVEDVPGLLPGEYETEPDLDIEQDSPDLVLPEDDEAVEFENVPTSDLPEVLPPGTDGDDDDEDAVLDGEDD